MAPGSSRRRDTRTFVTPVVLAAIALAVGSVIGFGGHLSKHAGGAASGQTTKSHDATSTTLGLKGTYSPQLPPPGTHETFDATFTGSSLDTHVWNTCYWYAAPGKGCGHPGVYNEDEWYLASQDVVSNGALNLVASPITTTGTNAQGQTQVLPCRSGMITTDPSFDFTYGYLQVVARIPKGRNTWPALWMLPADHSTVLPEIDIMEVVGTPTSAPAMAFHPATGSQSTLTAKTADLSSGWHTFGLNWQPGSLTWFVDGKAVFTVTNQVPDQPMYFLANLAITSEFQPLQLPASCSATMSIRSVEVWQKTSS